VKLVIYFTMKRFIFIQSTLKKCFVNFSKYIKSAHSSISVSIAGLYHKVDSNRHTYFQGKIQSQLLI